MKWSLSLGRISGIEVFVHWTFLILIAWILFSHVSMGHSWEQSLVGVVFILVLFACVLLHELGHALTGKRYGITTKNIMLLPIGGVANMEKMPEKPIQELWVALAGPAVNLVIAIVLFFVLRHFRKVCRSKCVFIVFVSFQLFVADLPPPSFHGVASSQPA